MPRMSRSHLSTNRFEMIVQHVNWQPNPNNELATAAYYGDLNVMNRILFDDCEKQLDSLLMLACTNDKFEAVKTLVQRGANVNFADQMGLTPLHVACFWGCSKIVRFLAECGAMLTAVTNVRNVDQVGKITLDDTPLHYACAGLASAAKVVRELLGLGVDPNVKNEIGQTPLHYAVVAPHLPKKVELLLKGGAMLDAIDQFGARPIHYASAQALRKLVEFGANIDDDVDALGRSSLHYTYSSNKEALLALGGGSNVKCRVDNCDCATSVLVCQYQYYRKIVEEDPHGCSKTRLINWTSPREALYAFESYFILTAVAGISLGEENKPANPPLDNIICIELRESFEKGCSAEFAKMDATIPGTRATYKGVMLQEPSALRDPKLKKILTINHCTARYPYYGELIYSGFILGQRKRPLITQCFAFFSIELGRPNFPESCMENILYRLRERDLRNLVAACGTSEN